MKYDHRNPGHAEFGKGPCDRSDDSSLADDDDDSDDWDDGDDDKRCGWFSTFQMEFGFEEIPLGATGKILKTKLREIFADHKLPTA